MILKTRITTNASQIIRIINEKFVDNSMIIHVEKQLFTIFFIKNTIK